MFESVQLYFTNLFTVLRVGEVYEVVIVHLLSVDDVAVLLLTQVFWVNAIGSQELLVRYAKCLANGLSNQLGLHNQKQRRYKWAAPNLIGSIHICKSAS